MDETYAIHVTGLEDEELTAALEGSLNRGENGKNLYGHLKAGVPEGEPLSVDYKDGRLSPVDVEREWDDASLRALTSPLTLSMKDRISESGLST